MGFNREVDESIVKHIWDRAGEFFPAIRALPLNLSRIRIGHRPYSKLQALYTNFGICVLDHLIVHANCEPLSEVLSSRTH